MKGPSAPMSAAGWAAALTLVLCGGNWSRAGRLGDIETAVRQSGQSHSGGYHPDSPDGYYGDWFPYYLTPFPYPYYLPAAAETPPQRWFSLTAAFHYFYDVKGDLDGYRGDVKFRTSFGALEFDFTRFREDLRPGHDYLNLYYVDYFFGIMSDKVIFEAGGGITGMYGEYHQTGGNLSGYLAFTPVRPFIFDLGLRYSSIKESGIFDSDAGIGVVYRFAEIRVGYRYLAFENAPDISGPEASLRFWF